MNRIRRGRQQILDHEIALGDPRPLIEQPRRLVERLEVELDQLSAERGPALQRIAVSGFRLPVAEEDQLSVARHAEAQIRGERRDRAERPVARERIGLVWTRHHGERQRGVVDGQSEYRDAVERAACRHQASSRDHAEARLQPDDVVEHRRHPAAAGGVRAQRQRHESGTDRDRRARARAAGNEILADRISGDAIRRAHADEAGCELVEIGLADDDRAGRAQALHRGQIMRRRIREGRAGRGGRKSQRVDIVLHRDRHAVERQAGGIPCGKLLGLRDRVLLVAQADEDCGIVVIADALIGSRDGLRRRDRARAMRGHNRGDRFRLLSPHGDKTPATGLTRIEASDVPLCTQSGQARCFGYYRRISGL